MQFVPDVPRTKKRFRQRIQSAILYWMAFAGNVPIAGDRAGMQLKAILNRALRFPLFAEMCAGLISNARTASPPGTSVPIYAIPTASYS